MVFLKKGRTLKMNLLLGELLISCKSNLTLNINYCNLTTCFSPHRFTMRIINIVDISVQ